MDRYMDKNAHPTSALHADGHPFTRVHNRVELHAVEDLAELKAENAILRQQVANLQAALDSRIIIEQAKGLIAGAAQVDMEKAFSMIRHYTRDRGKKLHAVSKAIVDIATGGPGYPAASPARLSKTPLYADIMWCWRNRARSPLRHKKVPSPWT